LTVHELKQLGFDIVKSNKKHYKETTLDIPRWEQEFNFLTEKEDCLRYLFYFSDTSRFYDPDKKDVGWRERVGFV
jgi:hypothetical protein